MYFYQVLVSSAQFHGSEPLTYSSLEELTPGTVVLVGLRRAQVAGVIVTATAPPKFKTKPIDRVLLAPPLRLPAQSLELLNWLKSYYPAPLGLLAQLFLPSSLVKLKEDAELPELVVTGQPTSLPALTGEQTAALKLLEASPARTAILHGDTGSGKTRLYLELALKTLQKGRSVLMLTPEIGLTPQFEARIQASLPYPMVTIHSNLTPVARRQIWLQVLQAKQPLVVLGPRSALFSPLKDLGLIVMDEFHDAAYKQEQAPYYQSRQVAAELAQLHGAQLVLGTATPLVSDYYLAEAHKAPIIRLVDKPAGAGERQIISVNLRDRAEFGDWPHLSKPLIHHIEEALAKQQQVLIFLNRRGTARVVLCQICGWQAVCPNCDIPLTFHADQHRVRCHTCGYQAPAPSSCPVCHSTNIIFKGSGTKAIFEEVKRAFPEARLQRFDTDNQKADRLEQHFEALNDGKIDIIIGTQMLTKGMDLPKLAVVGVIAADSSLNFPDYTAEERTYALLTQVIGRVGRGHLPGTVIIQSYNPDSPAIAAAINADWAGFYQQQLTERQNFGFPPFFHLLKLNCSRASAASASAAAHKLAKQLAGSGLKIMLSGPAPSFYEKVSGKYRWQLIVKAKDRGQLLKVVEQLPSGWTYDLDPSDLL